MTHNEPLDFFDEPKTTSLNKLGIFKGYLTPWAYKLLSRWDQIWVVDGFAGAGAYKAGDENAPHDGSPLIAAKWASELARTRGRVQLRCVNTEANRRCFDQLRANLAPWQHVAGNLYGEFAEHLDDILEQIGTDPTFFFLDPFGVRGIEMELIDQIATVGGEHNELLIHFSDTSFKRMAGHAREKERSEPGRRVAKSKAARIDRVRGTPLWRNWWAGETPEDESFDKLVELYLSQLRARGFTFVDQIRIRNSFTDGTRYRLIFATKSAHGFLIMNDLAHSYEQRLRAEHLNGQVDMFQDLEERQRRAKLKDDVFRCALEQGQRVSPHEIMAIMTPKRFADHKKSQYMNAIRALVRDGEVDREDAVGIDENEQLVFRPRAQGQLI